MLETIQKWLAAKIGQTAVDYLDSTTGSLGLYPTGCQVVAQSQDVLGNTRRKYRYTFTLKRVVSANAPHGEHAKWLMDFAQWVEQENRRCAAPVLGEDTQWFTRNGRLHKVSKAGTAIYSVELIAECMNMEEEHEN